MKAGRLNTELLLEWKEENRVRDEDIASQTSLNFSTVQKLLNGKTKYPHRLTVQALSNLTGYTIRELRKERPPGKRPS
jgi:transcriptional regulator with XRE-family HTH domain